MSCRRLLSGFLCSNGRRALCTLKPPSRSFWPGSVSQKFYSNTSGSPDLYEELQVPKNASMEEIKQSFYRLSKVYHPDKNASKEAQDRFQQLSQAYVTLTNKRSKRMYDLRIRNPFQPRAEGQAVDTAAVIAERRMESTAMDNSVNTQSESLRQRKLDIRTFGGHKRHHITFPLIENDANVSSYHRLLSALGTVILAAFGLTAYSIYSPSVS